MVANICGKGRRSQTRETSKDLPGASGVSDLEPSLGDGRAFSTPIWLFSSSGPILPLLLLHSTKEMDGQLTNSAKGHMLLAERYQGSRDGESSSFQGMRRSGKEARFCRLGLQRDSPTEAHGRSQDEPAELQLAIFPEQQDRISARGCNFPLASEIRAGM